MNDETCKKSITQIEQILTGLSGEQERRQQLISAIGNLVSRLSPIEEKPPTCEENKSNIRGALGEIEIFIETQKSDNDRLALIEQTLRRII